ncbi:hypothetical protein S245_008391, partial [Arachis hypogaea]
ILSSSSRQAQGCRQARTYSPPRCQEFVKPRSVIVVVKPEGNVVAAKHFCCSTSRTSTHPRSSPHRKCACSPHRPSSASRSFLPLTTSSPTTATTIPSSSSSIMAS